MSMVTISINGISLRVRCDGERSRPTVVLSNSLGTDLSMWDAQAAVLAAAVRAEGMSDIAAGAPGRWFTPEFVARQAVIVGSMQKTLRGQDPEGYAACCEALAVADMGEDLRRIAAPTLVIAGIHDPVTTVADAQQLARAIPNATVAPLPASHLSNIEAPDRFSELVASLLLA